MYTDTKHHEDLSYLFMVRVWAEDESDGRKKWCGKVQNVVYGNAQSFHDLPALVDHLLAMLPDLEDSVRTD